MHRDSLVSIVRWKLRFLKRSKIQRQPFLDASLSTFLVLCSAWRLGNTPSCPGSSAKPQMGDSYSGAPVSHSNQKTYCQASRSHHTEEIFITISPSLWANSPTRGTGHAGKQTHRPAVLCRHLPNNTRADVCFLPALAMFDDLCFLSSLWAWKCSSIPSYVSLVTMLQITHMNVLHFSSGVIKHGAAHTTNTDIFH